MNRICPVRSTVFGVACLLALFVVAPTYGEEVPAVDSSSKVVAAVDDSQLEQENQETLTELASSLDLACPEAKPKTLDLFQSVWPINPRGGGLCGAPPACNAPCTNDLYCKRCCNEPDQLSICHPSGCCLC